MKTRIVFLICLLTSVCLIVAGFIVPPTGVVDGSVLTAVGELLGFAALATGFRAIDKGLATTIKHGKTELQIKDPADE